MKRITYIALAAVLTGILIIGATLFFTKGNIKTTYTFSGKNGKEAVVDDERKEYVAKENITEIILGETSNSIKVEIGDVKAPTFSYMEGTMAGDLVINESGKTITLKRDHKNTWSGINFVGFDFTDYTTYVTLPKDYEGSLDLESTSGSLNVTGIETLTDLTTSSTSGNIHITDVISKKGIVAESTSGGINISKSETDRNIDAKSTSGSVSLENVKADGNGNVRSTSGSIKVTDASFGEDFSSSSSSGSEELLNVATGKGLSVHTTSGSINADNTAVGNDVSFESSSGSIQFDNLACGNDITMSATSGNIRGTISGKESDYSIITHTTSGSCNLDDSRSGDKELNANTSSGSIHIDFTK